ncbi:hypothetical protein MN116_002920 [Schistosoma mekongi]|uniref:DUF3668 domain-containing protein n=1 Tax=Schistosoma mekongi TaxID=38744 RepID=A0AAE1ZH71_SCHME|nr:hypothetical protein MN116_002920 [Schistosoma mekongi]
MQLKERCLVVIALITGRNFPYRRTYHLICEAKFNNEVLSTDPVEHNEEPQFEQELAWDLDKTSLKQHRLQRSALKVTVSAVDSQSPVREPIGFFMLDLRSCSTEKVYKWYRLLHSKYKNNPAVFASIYLDVDGQELVPNSKMKTGFAMSLSKADLIPRVYHSEDEDQQCSLPTSNITWYTIGPRCLAKEHFILTFQFDEAFKLGSLIPTEQSLCLGEQISGFHFTCELLGISIYSNQFSQLMQVKLTSEEKAFHIVSTVDILRIYFVHINPLVIKFCFGNHVLGQATVPIEQLIPTYDHVLLNPVVLNGKFDLISEESNQQFVTVNDSKHIEDKPRIGISITLRRYSDKNMTQQSSIINGSYCNRKLNNITDSLNHIPSTNVCPYSNVNTMNLNVNENYDQSVNLLPEKKNSKQVNGTLEFDDSIHTTKLLNSSQSTDNTPKLHRYCYTIELRSVKNIQGFDHELQLYARYVYPLFGSGAPVMTLPPISIFRHQEVILPHGFCAFEFAASPEELRTRLHENPLKVEFFDRSQGTLATDSFVGYALIPLVSIFESPIIKVTKESFTLIRRIHDNVNVLAQQSNAGEVEIIGQLVYSLQLEDFGVHTLSGNTTPVLDITKGLVHKVTDENKSETSDIRSTREYQVAMELELWRAAEEAKFTAQLKKREQTLMAILAEEWHKRDSQREIVCRKKLSEYQALEEKLRNTLIELATRERQLTAGEAELVRLKQENLREFEVKRKELHQQSQVQIRDLESQMKLEKKNSEHWKLQVTEWRSKYAALEEENSNLRSELNCKFRKSAEKVSGETSSTNQEVARLTAELAVARATLSETECRLVEVERGRAKYRQLWTTSLHELAKIKQEADETTRISLAQKEAELEQLKSYYLNDEKRPASRDSKEMINDGLKQSQKQYEMTTEISVTDAKPMIDEKTEAQIARLIEERDGLLNTGVYENSDSLIVDLDRQIRYLLEKS